MLSPATDLNMAPETVGHYTIDHELGKGQNGTVYLARDMRLDRPVALKVLDRSGEDAWGEALQEARLASALDHRNICTVYDVGEAESDDRSLPYIAMEYVEGRSLAETLEAGPLDRLMVRRYATQLCEALAYAHERGVAHGDVKASNVLITPEAEAKWVDFGSAVRSRRPEAISAQGDVWKMGILLYQMATGEDPSPGAADSPSERPAHAALGSPRPRGHHRTVPGSRRRPALQFGARHPGRPAQRRGEAERPRHAQGPVVPLPAVSLRVAGTGGTVVVWRRCRADRAPPAASANRLGFQLGMARVASGSRSRPRQANPSGG